MSRLTVATLLVFSLLVPVAFGEDGSIPRLESALNRDRVYIGDPVRYALRVLAPEGTEAVFPDFEGGVVGDFEIAESGGGEGEDSGVKWWERFYLLLGFQPGTYTLPEPSVTLRYPDGKEEKLKSSPLSLVVESLLEPEKTDQDIKESKSPVPLEANYLPLILLAAGGVIIVVLFFLGFRKCFRRKERVLPPPPPRPSHEIAYEELARIKSANLPAQGKIKEYFTRVSDVARRYLENRFGLRAPERTTEEFLIDMATTDVLSLPHQELVGNFLEKCDLVKFARYGPQEREIEDVYGSAVRLVDETKEGERAESGKVT